jgi:hypothetical protein
MTSLLDFLLIQINFLAISNVPFPAVLLEEVLQKANAKNESFSNSGVILGAPIALKIKP